jgi:hypothetical protein
MDDKTLRQLTQILTFGAARGALNPPKPSIYIPYVPPSPAQVAASEAWVADQKAKADTRFAEDRAYEARYRARAAMEDAERYKRQRDVEHARYEAVMRAQKTGGQ